MVTCPIGVLTEAHLYQLQRCTRKTVVQEGDEAIFFNKENEERATVSTK